MNNGKCTIRQHAGERPGDAPDEVLDRQRECEGLAAPAAIHRDRLQPQAEALADAAPAKIANSPELASARAQIELSRQAANAGPVQDLRAALARDPSNRQVMFDLATALHAEDNAAEAIDLLLDLFKLDREWNDGAAKAQLFTLFDALKPQDPLVLAGRRRLSSMIFV